MTARSQDRRTRIAEAAIKVLARAGSRGLTHRAIDQALKLPDGSTSYYFSTRAALLLAAAERLVALDAAEVDRLAIDFDGLVALVQHWLSPARRTRALARIELMLTAARDPAFRFMKQARQSFLDRVARSDSQVSAVQLLALVDGLLLHGLVSGTPSRNEVRQVFEQARTRRKTRAK